MGVLLQSAKGQIRLTDGSAEELQRDREVLMRALRAVLVSLSPIWVPHLRIRAPKPGLEILSGRISHWHNAHRYLLGLFLFLECVASSRVWWTPVGGAGARRQ